MRELEKILEEINEASFPLELLGEGDTRFITVSLVEEIIRKHMNDGWTPADERLPEEAGTYIVNALNGERSIVTFAKWKNRYKRFDMTGARAYWRVIAWRPLPEPYRPERNGE